MKQHALHIRCIVTLSLLCMTVDHPVIADEVTAQPQTIKVAAISFVPVKFDLESNASRLEQLFRKASSDGAQLAVSPEGALEGYVVNEIIAGEEPAERMKDVAVRIDDPTMKRFRNLAQELNMCLVVGFAERIGENVFNCAAFIGNDGTICGRYHKMQLAEGYHDSWWFNRLGRQSRAFDTPLGRCGVMICNDRWNAQLASIMRHDGAQFLVIPSFGSRSTAQDEAVLSRGRECDTPVVEANVGVTLIVNNGEISAVDRNEEGITFSEITIPPPRSIEIEKRDRVQKEFLTWRETEMKRRYEKTISRLNNRNTQ